MKKIKILAIDPATKCGWAHSAGISGVWDLAIKADESSGMRLIKLRAQLERILKKYGVNLLIFEASRNQRYGIATRVAAQLQAVLEIFCLDHKIDYKGFSPKAIKKFATSNGNANKEKMMQAAIAKWPDIKLVDDNHADALHLLDLGQQEYNIIK